VEHYVLTHYHSDHMAGLTPRWKGTIYCSRETALMLRASYPGVTALHPEPGEWEVLSSRVSIALLPVWHLHGSCMVVVRLEGTKKRKTQYVLVTGDAVLQRSDSDLVLEATGGRVPQRVLTDTTLYDEASGVFPTWRQTYQLLRKVQRESDNGPLPIHDRQWMAASMLLAMGHTEGVRLAADMIAAPQAAAFPSAWKRPTRGRSFKDWTLFAKPPSDGKRHRYISMSCMWFVCHADRDRKAFHEDENGVIHICLATHSDKRAWDLFFRRIGVDPVSVMVSCVAMRWDDKTCPR